MDNKNVNNKKDIEEITQELPVDETIAQVINCTHLNLRKTPDIKGDIMVVLQAHSNVVIEREVNNLWTKVQVDGVTGFVMSKYIEVI